MTGMKIIKPTAITDAMLSQSSVPEPDAGEVLWNAGTAYALKQVAIRTTTHRKYERLVAGTTATPPEDDPANWLDIGPTNRWAMLDRKVGTVTTAASNLSVVVRPGGVSGVAVLEATGRSATVTLKDAPAGSVVYQRQVSLDATPIETVYDWFFEDFEQLTDFVLTDLPAHYTNGELTVQVTGTSGASVGVLQVGKVIEVGSTQYGASVGILDFSPKSKDRWGNVDVLEGAYSKRCSLQVVTKKSDFNKLFRLLASLRATPCVYIGADQVGYEPMFSYGYYKDFGMVVSYPEYHLLNIEIEGLT